MFRKHVKTALGLSVVAAVGTQRLYKNWQKSRQVEPTIKPEGGSKNINTLLLEAGAKVLQTTEPLKNTNIYFVGFHPMKDNSCHQMEAHHYCKQANQDFAQCLLYDGNTKNTNLTGLEYIISEKLYNELSEEERKYWHPHNYEILSGQLVAPGLPEFAEKAFMKSVMNSYGKTYHTWRAKCWEGENPFMDTLSKGEAILAWSFNHQNENKPELIETRDKNMKINTEKKRQEREDLIQYAHPQTGVNDMSSKFKNPQPKSPGVVDIKEVPSQPLIEKAKPSMKKY